MQMQSHGLNMTLVSIEQLRATLWQKSNKNSKCSKDKTGNSFKQWGKLQVNTNKHEDLNLMFANHGKRMEYAILLQ